MQAEFDRALAMLARHLSAVNARQLLLRALRQNGVRPEEARWEDICKCKDTLRRGVELFVEQQKRDLAFRDIDAHCGVGTVQATACTLQITAEQDIGKARAETRRISDAAGASAFTMQKVATIVSELARNMVLYASGGVVEIALLNTGPRRIVVKATDTGSGIRNLEEVMSGKYKSKTGMGRGLFGTKRLADRFDISSDQSGTRVVAEVHV